MIELSHLTRQFGSLRAVEDLSLKLEPGEILGFLGPNGAGKSTTMKMLTGFLVPTSGRISVFGHDVGDNPISAQEMIGYLPEGAPCYEDMTPETFLNFIAEIRGFRDDEKRRRVDDVVKKMSLQPVLHQKIETLSKGFKRRVGLAQAIIHDPKVLILDEPTDGLDPNQKKQVRDLILGLSKDKIVIISTHILEEVAAVCSRVVIVSEGKLVVDCSAEELEKQSRFHGAVTLILPEDVDADLLRSQIEPLSSVDSLEVSGTSITVFPKDNRQIFSVLSGLLTQQGIAPESMFQEKGRLEDVFRQITTGESA